MSKCLPLYTTFFTLHHGSSSNSTAGQFIHALQTYSTAFHMQDNPMFSTICTFTSLPYNYQLGSTLLFSQHWHFGNCENTLQTVNSATIDLFMNKDVTESCFGIKQTLNRRQVHVQQSMARNIAQDVGMVYMYCGVTSILFSHFFPIKNTFLFVSQYTCVILSIWACCTNVFCTSWFLCFSTSLSLAIAALDCSCLTYRKIHQEEIIWNNGMTEQQGNFCWLEIKLCCTLPIWNVQLPFHKIDLLFPSVSRVEEAG